MVVIVCKKREIILKNKENQYFNEMQYKIRNFDLRCFEKRICKIEKVGFYYTNTDKKFWELMQMLF